MSDPTPRPVDEDLEVLVQDTPMPDIDTLVARTHSLLASGVPLTLLLDLASTPTAYDLGEGGEPRTWPTPRPGADDAPA